MIHGRSFAVAAYRRTRGLQRGRFRVLVATDLASRGIHVQDIVHVINYDLPEVAENFIHRVGRTGRAGGKRRCSTLFVKDSARVVSTRRALASKWRGCAWMAVSLSRRAASALR